MVHISLWISPGQRAPPVSGSKDQWPMKQWRQELMQEVVNQSPVCTGSSAKPGRTLPLLFVCHVTNTSVPGTRTQPQEGSCFHPVSVPRLTFPKRVVDIISSLLLPVCNSV